MPKECIFTRNDEGCVAGGLRLEDRFDYKLLEGLSVEELDFEIKRTEEGPLQTGGIPHSSESSYQVFLPDGKSVVLSYSKLWITANNYSEQIHLAGNPEDIVTLKGIILKSIAEKSYRIPK